MTADLPAVTNADAFADQQFFADFPARRYRRRPGPEGTFWLVRRRGRDVYLRTLARTAIRLADNSDEALRPLWFESAWPGLDPIERDWLVREARKTERATARAPPQRKPGQ